MSEPQAAWTDMAAHAPLPNLLRLALQARHHQALLRVRPSVRRISPTRIEMDGRQLIDFCSNDYLGLAFGNTQSPLAATENVPASGAGASALLGGYGAELQAAEAAMAAWKKYPACLLLPSGYQANVAAIQTLAALGKSAPGGVRFLIDKLLHASLLDGLSAAGASYRVFPHNHLGKVRRLLMSAPDGQMQVVVTEAIFSMDGDAAPLRQLAQLKQEFPFVLLVDEAHATGVYGLDGGGLAEELAVTDAVDISIATLSKALGCQGGAICASSDFCQAVVNDGRAYIYSTALSPLLCQRIMAAINQATAAQHARQHLRKTSGQMRDLLADQGWTIPPGDSPIIPLIVGQEDKALAAARWLQERGLWIAAVRTPTVPRGQSRLRLTLSAAHTPEQLDLLTVALSELFKSHIRT